MSLGSGAFQSYLLENWGKMLRPLEQFEHAKILAPQSFTRNVQITKETVRTIVLEHSAPSLITALQQSKALVKPAVSIDQSNRYTPIRRVVMPIRWNIQEERVDSEENGRAENYSGNNLFARLMASLRMAHNRYIDESLMIGVADGSLDKGLLRSDKVTNSAVNNSAKDWSDPATTIDDILTDIDELITSVSEASNQWHNGIAIPDTILIPFNKMRSINARITNTGINGLKYVRENSMYSQLAGGNLRILPSLYLSDDFEAGLSSRMVAYNSKGFEGTPFLEYKYSEPQMLPDPKKENGNYENVFEWMVGSCIFNYPTTVGYRNGI